MDSSERDNKLREIANQFFPAEPVGLLGALGAPFDISKPNFHDSKSEFLAEKTLVEETLKAASLLSSFLVSAAVEDRADHEITNRVAKCVDATVSQNRSGSGISNLTDMMRNTASDLGACWIMTYQIHDVIEGLFARKQELLDQELNFWSANSRPPNHYARAIALRFARLIAKKTGKKPTFGTSKDGGHPSTDFGRALEEMFDLLEITAQVKKPCRLGHRSVDRRRLHEGIAKLPTESIRRLDWGTRGTP